MSRVTRSTKSDTAVIQPGTSCASRSKKNSDTSQSPNLKSPVPDIRSTGLPTTSPSWTVNGENLEKITTKIREDITRNSTAVIPMAAPGNASSIVRTEFRKIISCCNVMNEAEKWQLKQIEWMKKSVDVGRKEIQTLHDRCGSLTKMNEDLYQKIIDDKMNITRKTQNAVNTVLEMRAEDEDFNDGDQEDYSMFTDISKLCDVALTSFDRMVAEKKKIKLISAAQKRRLSAIRNRKSGAAPTVGYEKSSSKLMLCSLEDLAKVRTQLSQISH